MKGKIMAVAAVLVMVFAAVGVVMPQAGDSNADTTTTDLGTIILPAESSQTGTKTINTTEGEFTGYAYTMTITATIGSTDTVLYKITYDGSTTDTPTAETNTATGTGFSLAVTKNAKPSVGSYTLTATTTGTDVTPTTVTIKAVIAPKVDGSSDNTQTIEYTVKVMDVNDESQTMYLNTPTEVTGGSYYVYQVKASTGGTSYNADNAMTVSSYTWYAYGLPDGLSMSSNGYISGIYTGTGTSATVKVVAMNASEVYTGTLNLTMTEFTEKEFKLTVTESSTAVSEGAPIVKTTSTSEKMTLTLSAELGSDSTITGTKYSVIAVDSTGAVKDLNSSSSTNTTVEVPLSGSGAYRIVVTATYTADGATYEDTVSFYLCVMPVLKDLSAHISVTTNSS